MIEKGVSFRTNSNESLHMKVFIAME